MAIFSSSLRTATAAATLALAAGSLAACGGDDAPEAAYAASPQEVLLTADELPEGFTISSNEESATKEVLQTGREATEQTVRSLNFENDKCANAFRDSLLMSIPLDKPLVVGAASHPQLGDFAVTVVKNGFTEIANPSVISQCPKVTEEKDGVVSSLTFEIKDAPSVDGVDGSFAFDRRLAGKRDGKDMVVEFASIRGAAQNSAVIVERAAGNDGLISPEARKAMADIFIAQAKKLVAAK